MREKLQPLALSRLGSRLQLPLGFFVVCYIYRDCFVYAIVKNIIINIFSLVSWFAYDLLLTYILLTRFFVLFFIDLVVF